MPNLTLATAPITNADQFIVELVTPPDAPAVILIKWPDQPPVCPPRPSTHCRGSDEGLAASRVTLAQIKVGER